MQDAKKLNITNCWICTHAPISHKTFSSLLGIPSTLAKMEDSVHFGEVSRTMIDRAISLLLFTNAPLRKPAVCINFYFDRVIPATWYMEDNDFQETQLHKIPIHFLKKDFVHLVKRNLTDQSAPGEDEIPGGKEEEEDSEINEKNDNSPDRPTFYPKSDDNFTNVESHDREIKPLFSILWVNRCCIKKAFSFIIDLADLMDNITALYDRNFIALAIELKMIKKEVLQPRLVLDYLTASQGGICAIVGTTCCNYIGNDTKTEDAIISHVEKVQQMKVKFHKEYTETTWVEGSWESWLSWLNPLNWFSGIVGWFSGILHGILYIVGIRYKCYLNVV